MKNDTQHRIPWYKSSIQIKGKKILKIIGEERKVFLKKIENLHHGTSHLHNGNWRTSVGDGNKVSAIQKCYTVIIPVITAICYNCYKSIFKLKRKLVSNPGELGACAFHVSLDNTRESTLI